MPSGWDWRCRASICTCPRSRACRCVGRSPASSQLTPMPHAEIHNSTGFAYVATVVSDEQAVPQHVSIVQAEYSFNTTGGLELLEEQIPPTLAGEWYGDPATSSIRLEPQFAFVKPS